MSQVMTKLSNVVPLVMKVDVHSTLTIGIRNLSYNC
jgi:hypothetical protein